MTPIRTAAAAAATLLIVGALPAIAAAAPVKCLGETVTIAGTNGDDEIEGTPGRDVIHGGGGIDVVRAGKGNDLVCGGPRNDNLYGQGGRDKLDGGPGFNDDYLFGGDGPDVLLPRCSGEEGDLLDAGAGADRLVGSSCGSTEMLPGPGDDDVRGTIGRVEFRDAAEGVVVDLAAGIAEGEGRDRIRIHTEPDAESWELFTIVGTDAVDELYGGPGRDSFDGLGGDDVVHGRGGDDWLTASVGADDLRGGDGDDTFQVADGTVARGEGGDDRVICEPRWPEGEQASFDGGPGSDWEVFLGLPSDATVDLGAGTSSCVYTYPSIPPSSVRMDIALTGVENASTGSGSLLAIGSDGPNTIVGGNGADELDGGGGDDVLIGGGGRDELFGGDGDDDVSGGRWDDNLSGGAGDDTLDGEEGSDSVDGGPGNDACTGEERLNCESP